MKEEYFYIKTGRYPVSCKLYTPGADVKGIILGVHGFVGDKESSALCALAEVCADKGIALLCFDFPAHGTSEATEADLTVENCMSDLLDCAAWCCMEYPDAKKYLFATSFGGYITLLCSPKLADFRIVLRAPAITMPEHILTDLLKTTPEDFRRRKTITCGFDRKIDLPYGFYQNLQKHRVSECFCNNPLLIIQGDKDDIVPLNDVVSFCAAHKNATLKIIDGADHRFKNPGEIEKVIAEAIFYWNI